VSIQDYMTVTFDAPKDKVIETPFGTGWEKPEKELLF